jgi:HSP20 family molecular chaperone IbpA
MTQGYALKGMRSTNDFDTMWHNQGGDNQGAILAHQTVAHIYPEGELQVEFVEKINAYWLIAELPDIQQDDITICVDGDVLSILGEWPEEVAMRGSAKLIRPYRSFARQFRLDEPVDAEAITMTYTDGVLAVCVPKFAQPQAATPTHELVENA